MQDRTPTRGNLRFHDWLYFVVSCGRHGHPAAMRLERRAMRRARVFMPPRIRRMLGP